MKLRRLCVSAVAMTGLTRYLARGDQYSDVDDAYLQQNGNNNNGNYGYNNGYNNYNYKNGYQYQYNNNYQDQYNNNNNGYQNQNNNNNNNGYQNQNGNAGKQGDDGYQSYNKKNYQQQNAGNSIKYWTQYAILPKRCIVYNNVDMVVFSIYDNIYKHCGDDAVGTYIAPVPQFLNGYLNQMAQDAGDQGNDYEKPDVAQYVQCTPYMIQNKYYYLQVGCADDSSQALAVNIYEDNTCSTRSVVDGYDDSNLDVSAIELPFKKCQACVNWFDMDNKADDGYYENHQTNAPFCSAAWTYKEVCDRKCRHTGLETSATSGWNTSDKVLLAILSFFGLVMLGLIIRKRQKMSNKDALLEQAAMNAAGMQQPHVIGVFILAVLVIAVFALLGLKNITWALLLIINTALFGYLMKLTVDSGVSTGETVIGPDGTILRKDSDDSSMDSSRESSRRGLGTLFTLPTIA